jgi:hypothetical protein
MKLPKNQKEQNSHPNYSPNKNSNINQKGERVLVYVRIRPFNQDELKRDKSTPLEFIDTKNNAMICNYNNIFIYIIFI